MEQHINGNEHLYSYLYVSLSDPLNTSHSPDWLVKPQIKPLQLIEAFMEYGCLSKAIRDAILASLDVYVCKASIRRQDAISESRYVSRLFSRNVSPSFTRHQNLS